MEFKRKLPASLAVVFAGVLVVVMTITPETAAAAESFTEMFTKGKTGVAFRYRFEYVDQENLYSDAKASTLRGRLNFRADDWHGFGAFAEFDYVANVFWDNYNAGGGNTPDKTGYPVVADPTGSDLNQAFLQWQNADAGTLIRSGRQQIIYDNARFVGNVGWRQNEQTYDAVYFQQKVGTLDAQLAYVWQVNRIFGDDVPDGKHGNASWLGNLAYQWKGLGMLTGYIYDIANDDVAAFSSSTYGARLAGSTKFSENDFGYAAEYAHQTDAHNNPVDFSANYYRVDASLSFGKTIPYIGFETLGGDAAKASASFRTPLATLHGFNGWADMFLTTPAAGLDDLFAGIRGGLASWNWDMIFHDFDAESGSQSYGSEFDASLSRKFAKKYSLLLKAAFFDSKDSSAYPDTTRFWVQLSGDF